jgi:2-methylisocitrate lyase-like PEP mutase family enzyme
MREEISMQNFKERRVRLKAMLGDPNAYIAPGCPNAIIAKLIEEAGFEVVFVSGAGIANFLMGFADMGLQTMTEIVTQVRYIADATHKAPIIADADTGFGNALNVMRTVRDFERAGASAIMLEDQNFPKRCGHFGGKGVISKEEMVGRLKAALDTREDENTLIIARTDSGAIYGIDDAVERAYAYREAGADMTFIEAPKNLEELNKVGMLSWPQVANMVEGSGVTPVIPLAELDKMGFKIIYYANAAARGALLGAQRVLAHLRQHGDTLGVSDQMVTWEERQRIVELPMFRELEVKYGCANQ